MHALEHMDDAFAGRWNDTTAELAPILCTRLYRIRQLLDGGYSYKYFHWSAEMSRSTAWRQLRCSTKPRTIRWDS